MDSKDHHIFEIRRKTSGITTTIFTKRSENSTQANKFYLKYEIDQASQGTVTQVDVEKVVRSHINLLKTCFEDSDQQHEYNSQRPGEYHYDRETLELGVRLASSKYFGGAL